jgi:hypothetical protein
MFWLELDGVVSIRAKACLTLGSSWFSSRRYSKVAFLRIYDQGR